MNPPIFYGITDLPLPETISRETGLPSYIINDASAGALAENIYGRTKNREDILYVHIMGGIGVGYILKHQVYDGTSGKSGEIGHTSINFAGPLCDCGNAGCLEVYANIENINAKINDMKEIYNVSSSLPASDKPYTFSEVINAAENSDIYAISALDDFCGYLSQALTNTINLFDIHHIIVGYDSYQSETIIEKILYEKLNSNIASAKHRHISVEKSIYGGSAPLIGSIALVTSKLFDGIWVF